jgi:hypothetical protein
MEVTTNLERPLPAGTEANPQPSPPKVDEADVVHQDDDEVIKERGLEALNQIHEEIQENRRRVKAHQKQARLHVIRQKADEARDELRRMDE